MSTKNGHITTPPYISHVRLKGYKSIIDTKVDLHPGLNIIIGPNGSGKTNFLEFLYKSLIVNPPTGKFSTKIEISDGSKEIAWETKSSMKKNSFNSKDERIFLERSYLKKEKKPKRTIVSVIDNPGHTILNREQSPPAISLGRLLFIKYSLPKEVIELNSRPFNISISKDLISKSFSGALKYFGTDIMFNSSQKYYSDLIESSIVPRDKTELLEALAVNETLKRNLKKFSPIQDVRLEEEISIKEDRSRYVIDYIRYEFLVNEHWLSWSMLSDGTKRLFYLISEITLHKGTCLIEEPEIGIHPDQYRKILTFLKEESEDKQIIITTHAPRTLDILKDNELNRIILTRFDKELGTKMRHLKKKEIKQAIQYRENDGSTSELWTYTGFFDEEEVI